MDEETYWFKNILNPLHPYHGEYLKILADDCWKDPKVYDWGCHNIRPAMPHPLSQEKVYNRLLLDIYQSDLSPSEFLRGCLDRIGGKRVGYYGKNDFSKAMVKMLLDAGIDVAFQLTWVKEEDDGGPVPKVAKQDFRPDTISRTYMGYKPEYVYEDIGEIPLYQVTESVPIGYEEEWLRKIIELTREEGIELIFFQVPYLANEQFQKRCRYMKEIAAENGIPVLDMMEMLDELGMDTAQDFMDWGHLNEYGARKVSAYMGQYLAENYGLEDKRGTEGYGLWDENLKVWRHQVQNHDLQQITDLGSYLTNLVNLQDYTVVLIAEGEFPGEALEGLREKLALTGAGESFLAGESVCVVKDGAVLYESPKEGCFRFMGIGESDLLLHANDGKMHIIVDRVEYDRVEYGIAIVLYDNVLGMVADAVGFPAWGEGPCVR